MNIAERIRHLRKNELKMTQDDFASKIDISRSNIGNIEIGRIAVTERIIASICREFSVNEEWLRTGSGEMFKQPSDEIGYYVEDLLEYDGHGNPFYDMIIEMMKKYQELDEKSKTVIREYFKSVGSGLNEKRED